MGSKNTGVYDIPPNPELEDLFRQQLRKAQLTIRTSTLARVVASDLQPTGFDPATQLVSLMVQVPIIVKNPANPQVAIPAPPVMLKNIPVSFPCSGTPAAPSYVSIPINVGDTGELVIQDRDPSIWLMSGAPVDPVNRMTHNLAFGVFHPGLKPQAERITNYDPAATVVEGSTQIKIGALAQPTQGAARFNDAVRANEQMIAWMAVSNTLLTALAGLLGVTPPMLPTFPDIANINASSAKTFIE